MSLDTKQLRRHVAQLDARGEKDIDLCPLLALRFHPL